MDHFYPHMATLRACGREVIVCADWNIAHKEIDLKNWRSNQKNSGFLPEERAWMSRVQDEQGWIDVYRRLHPEATDACYTWWSNRGQARANNVGWRLDYQLATPAVAATLLNVFHLHRTAFFGSRPADHRLCHLSGASAALVAPDLFEIQPDERLVQRQERSNGMRRIFGQALHRLQERHAFGIYQAHHDRILGGSATASFTPISPLTSFTKVPGG